MGHTGQPGVSRSRLRVLWIDRILLARIILRGRRAGGIGQRSPGVEWRADIHSLAESGPASEAFGITRNRSDLTGALSYFLTPSIATFVGTGRTLSSNPAATSFMLNAGVSMSFTPRVTP
jgi:hypothetical protein